MNKMPKALRARLAADPYMRQCARDGPDCDGRVTWEHSLYARGRQLQEAFAIVPLCHFHHLGKGLNKELNRHLAYQRATDADFDKYPRSSAAWRQEKKYLEGKYGNAT
ncbi:MAG: hypothetical protein Q8Q08_12895 [Candidatus Omnitrophota bacterium]|nr:hypothetical protein [Candidatus Omnitrophota bacterium]